MSIKKRKGKVHNVCPNVYDGIKFKSKLETYTYKKLKEANIKAEYEAQHFELLPKFEYNGEKIRAMTYLPDFIGDNFIIECKGYANDVFPLKKKLFRRWMETQDYPIIYAEIHTKKELLKLIEEINGRT